MTSNIPDATESERLDDINAVTSTIIAHISGEELDKALATVLYRRGRTDVQLRRAAMENVHPDDLLTALVQAGHTLARYGIASVSR